jgi:predicted component of viral defense system (DUF524 family)
MKLLIRYGANQYQLLPGPDHESALPDDLIAENQTYQLRLVGSADDELAGCHLFLGDVDLGAGRYERPGELSWPWEVRDYVGEMTLGVERDGQVLLSTDGLVVDPHRSKLTRDQFATMVDDISAEATIAYSLSPATQHVELGQQRQALNLAQLEYMRRQIGPLRRAVEAIARRPRRALVDQSQVLDLALARAPDDRSIVWLLGRPAELATVPDQSTVPVGARDLHGRLQNHLPRRLQVSRRRITFDIYENRLIRHFLCHLNVVLRHSQDRLSENVDDASLDEPIRRLAWRRLGELKRQRRALYNLLELDFLQEVGSLHHLQPATPVLLKDPLYARFYRLYREFARAITPFDGAPFRLSLEKTWQLYEYWCFFQVVAALRQLMGDALAFDARRFLECHPDRISLAMSKAEVTVSPRLRVYFQKSYAYYNYKRVGSYSHELRPDISIEVLDADGRVEQIILLDPKYRVSDQSLNQAMDELHRYKDAIVGPDRRHLVRTALALCPSDEKAKSRYFEFDYIRTHGLGAVVLKPGDADAPEQLAHHLSQLVPGLARTSTHG